MDFCVTLRWQYSQLCLKICSFWGGISRKGKQYEYDTTQMVDLCGTVLPHFLMWLGNNTPLTFCPLPCSRTHTHTSPPPPLWFSRSLTPFLSYVLSTASICNWSNSASLPGTVQWHVSWLNANSSFSCFGWEFVDVWDRCTNSRPLACLLI